MTKKDFIIVAILVVLGILSRTAFHLGNNIEFITAISIVSGYIFKQKKLAFLTTFLTLAISDTVLGNSVIFVFTWSAFLIGNLLGILLAKLNLKNHKFIKTIFAAEGAGILSTIIFYLWTNLGVVLTTNSYAKSLAGLLQSYTNAIPFLRPQLGFNLIIVPVVIGLVYFLIKFNIAQKLKLAFKN